MKKIFLLLLYSICGSYCFAQDGALNTTYVPQSPFTTVYAMVLDGGGNTFVAGSNPGTGIAMDIVKIKPDGTIDTYFNCTYFDNFVYPNLIVVKNMCLQDGKLLVCGQLRDIPFYELAAVRFNINGSLDTTFNVSLPDNFTGDDIVIQPVTNKILIAGQGGIGGPNYTGKFFRLLSDGSTDTTFNAGGSSFNSDASLTDILTLSNGDMYVCGGFDTYNGAARKNIIKLNADGSLNALTFTPINAWYKRMALQSTGKLVVIGQFYDSAYPGLSTIARFNTTGTLDTTFTPPSPSTPPYAFNDVKIQTDDKIVIGGEFTVISGASRTGIARLSESGTHDTCFNPGYGVTINPTATAGSVKCIIMAGTVFYIGGTFNYYNSTARKALAKINGIIPINAVTDSGSISSAGGVAITNVLANDTFNGAAATTSSVTLYQIYSSNPGITLNTANGQITVAAGTPPGTYTLAYQICQIGSNYCICDDVGDTITVLPSINAVNDIVTVPAGATTNYNIYANDTYNGAPVNTQNPPFTYISLTYSPNFPPGIVLYNGYLTVTSGVPVGIYTITYTVCAPTTATCDTATVTITVSTPQSVGGVRANAPVGSSGIMSNHKIIIAGGFDTYNNIPAMKIAKLNSDLTLDTSFNPLGPGPDSTEGITDLVIQPDDYIVVVGKFNNFSGVPSARGVARLLTDGTPDPAFSAGTGAAFSLSPSDYFINGVALQPDGKIILVGTFDSFNGVSARGIIRLNPNGSVDTTFNSGSGFAPGDPDDVAIQPDGKIIVTGHFTSYNGAVANAVVRLWPNGAIDTTFSSGSGITGSGSGNLGIVIQPNGRIIIHGDFSAYNGVPKGNIVRLNTNGSIDPSFTGSGTNSNSPIWGVALEPNGSMYIAGGFTYYNGTPVKRIIRVSSNNVIDTSFSPGNGPSGNIYTITRQPDGKVIIGGNFQYYNNVSVYNVTRINPAVAGGQARTMPGNEEIDGKEIILYPNPSNGVFNVDLSGYDENTTFEVTVYNPLGQLIYKGSITAQGSNAIDLTGHETGNYFITLQNNLETINRVVTVKR